MWAHFFGHMCRLPGFQNGVRAPTSKALKRGLKAAWAGLQKPKKTLLPHCICPLKRLQRQIQKFLWLKKNCNFG
jgi:hypothetical protein